MSDEAPSAQADQAQTSAAVQETADRLAERILEGEFTLTREQVASLAGAPLTQARVLWRSMGFADVGDAVAFTQNDVAALRTMLGVIGDSQLDEETATDLVRSMGQSASRLAEWQLNSIANFLATAAEASDEPRSALVELSDLESKVVQMMPALEKLLVYAWRRQLAAAVDRMAAVVGAPVDGGETGLLSVGFADMVGFTRLSRRLPSRDLAALVSRFEAVSSDIVAAEGGRVVKTVGDEILFVAPDAQRAAEVALALHETHAEDETVPEMRIGLATGNVLSRMGDVFGTTVNLASRLTAMARPGGTLVDLETRQALATQNGYSLRGQPPRPVRGLGVVRPFSLARASQ